MNRPIQIKLNQKGGLWHEDVTLKYQVIKEDRRHLHIRTSYDRFCDTASAVGRYLLRAGRAMARAALRSRTRITKAVRGNYV